MKDEFKADGGGAADLGSSFIPHPSSFNFRIVKLGGSLLAWAEWPAAFRRWLSMQSDHRTVVIVGGGGTVDAVREWDRAHRLDSSDAHWLAIDAMSLTSRLAARLLTEAEWTDEWQALCSPGWPGLDRTEALVAAVGVHALARVRTLKRELRRGLLIFEPSRFLHDIEPTAAGTPLPQSWDVTSDSIAARIADLLGSQELVLLKSCLPQPQVATLEEASAAHFVDRCFPTLAAKLPLVRLVNLREGSFAEVRFSSVPGSARDRCACEAPPSDR